jgi:hypothetical protein
MENLSSIFECQGRTSVNKDILPYIRTFDHELYVYNTRMQFHGYMTVKHLFIIQDTDLTCLET